MKDNQTLQVKLDADKAVRLSQLQNCLDALKLNSYQIFQINCRHYEKRV